MLESHITIVTKDWSVREWLWFNIGLANQRAPPPVHTCEWCIHLQCSSGKFGERSPCDDAETAHGFLNVNLCKNPSHVLLACIQRCKCIPLYVVYRLDWRLARFMFRQCLILFHGHWFITRVSRVVSASYQRFDMVSYLICHANVVHRLLMYV